MERKNQNRAILCAIIAMSSTQLIAGCNKQSSTPAAPEAPAAPTAATPGPTAAAPAAPVAPASASPADPRDAPLGAFAHEVAQAVLHAAKGEPVDAKWLASDATGSVATLSDDARHLIAELGPSISIVAAELEVDEIAQPGPGEHHQVMTHAVMLTDGSIRWSTTASRREESEIIAPTPGLDVSAPPLVASAARAIEGLRANCTLPWLAESDVTSIPASIRSEFVTDMTTTHAACTQVQGVHGEWRPHVDDIRVLVTGNNHFGFLNSMFDIEGAGADGGGHLILRPLHVELVSEGAGAAGAAPPAAEPPAAH